MKVSRIYYEKCFPLGGYSNEKVGMEVVLTDGESTVEGFALCKKEVEKAHKFFAEYPSYQEAVSKVVDSENITPREMKRYAECIDVFEANYPEYIHKFIPVGRQLNENKEEEYYHPF